MEVDAVSSRLGMNRGVQDPEKEALMTKLPAFVATNPIPLPAPPYLIIHSLIASLFAVCLTLDIRHFESPEGRINTRPVKLEVRRRAPDSGLRDAPTIKTLEIHPTLRALAINQVNYQHLLGRAAF